MVTGLFGWWFTWRIWNDKKPLPACERRPSEYRVLRPRLYLYSASPYFGTAGVAFAVAQALLVSAGNERTFLAILALFLAVVAIASLCVPVYFAYLFRTSRPLPLRFVPTPWKYIDQGTMPERPSVRAVSDSGKCQACCPTHPAVWGSIRPDSSAY